MFAGFQLAKIVRSLDNTLECSLSPIKKQKESSERANLARREKFGLKLSELVIATHEYRVLKLKNTRERNLAAFQSRQRERETSINNSRLRSYLLVASFKELFPSGASRDETFYYNLRVRRERTKLVIFRSKKN